MKLQMFALFAMCSSIGLAQLTIPDGTKLRVRLDHPLSSATAEEGQSIEFTVAERIKVNDVVVVKDGARVTGTVTQAVGKRPMGRAGKLDFSIDRVFAADGQWVPLRYSLQKKNGESRAVRTGFITAGVALAVPIAAPIVLVMKGKDINLNKGMTFDVFTDGPHAFTSSAGFAATDTPAPPLAAGTATITVTATAPSADIEVNGRFVGNTPTTLQLPAGAHSVTVKSGYRSWERRIQVAAGSTVSLNAVLDHKASVPTRLN